MKIVDVLIALFCEVVGWLAFPLAPVAVLLAHRNPWPSPGAWGSGADVPRGCLRFPFEWLDTPDEPLPGGMYEPQVRGWYDRYGWRVCAVLWLWRNRAFRLAFSLGRPVDSYDAAPWRHDWVCGILKGTVGWKVYRATPGAAPLIAVRALSIRFNWGES